MNQLRRPAQSALVVVRLVISVVTMLALVITCILTVQYYVGCLSDF